MDKEQIKHLLKKNRLFCEMDEATLSRIAEISTLKKVPQHDLLIQENTAANHVYLILSGRFSVYKQTAERDTTAVEFGILNPGETVGELAFLDEKPRSANVKALDENSIVLEIPYTELTQVVPISFYRKLSKKLSHQIRSGNDTLVEKLRMELELNKKMANMGRFITYVLLLISFYDLALTGFVSLAKNPYTSMFASTSVIALFTVVLAFLIKIMGYPLSFYGFNLKNWQKSIAESLFFTAIIIFFLTALKWLYIQFVNPNLLLFDFQAIVPQAPLGSLQFYGWFLSGIVVYSIFCLFQEFISRGVLQSSLQNFLGGNKWIANVVTSGVFSAMHIHLSPVLAVIVFFPSLFWGWLYARQGSLLGPVISHILLGCWAIFALGIQDLLK